MIEHLPRWVHASIKDYLKKQWIHPLIVEGEDNRNSKAPIYAELRIDGPVLRSFGTKGNYKLMVEINFAVTAQKDQKYVHGFQDLLGKALKVLNQCIPIRKVGSEMPEDNGDFVTTLQIEEDLDLTNFGQVEVTVQTQQGTVEAAYTAILEI